ncbi:MAG: metallophosphoesterase family protein [Armatimonadetes bacterium]|nr:metallophosphoesterase family protein [Armatimonadota bacterium]
MELQIAAGLGAAALIYANVVEPRLPVLIRRTLHVPGLPDGWRGGRIALISDLHAPMIASVRRWVPRALAGEYDFVAVPGDFAVRARHIPRAVETLLSLRSRLGVFATLGNIEYKRRGEAAKIAESLESSGVRLLNNSFVRLERNGDPVFLCGVDDPYTVRDDLAAAAPPVPGFRLLLAHAPQVFEREGIESFDLVLCGHTHGGLVRLFGRPVFAHARMERRYSSGWVETPGKPPVFVSRGIGTGHPMARVFCRPAVYELTLERADEACCE